MPKPFPLVTAELLKELEEHFPDRAPDPTKTDREIWMAAGAVSVVRFLKLKHKQQQSANVLQ